MELETLQQSPQHSAVKKRERGEQEGEEGEEAAPTGLIAGRYFEGKVKVPPREQRSGSVATVVSDATVSGGEEKEGVWSCCTRRSSSKKI